MTMTDNTTTVSDTIPQLSFPRLSTEVMDWARANFNGKYNSYLGMIEELGELAHCCLKRHQGIRGYDNLEFYQQHYIDAIGDIGVYAANFAYMEGITLDFPDMKSPVEPDNRNEQFAWCCLWLSRCGPEKSLDEKRFALNNFFICVNLLARMEGTSFAEATNRTWAKVKTRNWINNPTSGGESG